MEKLTIPAAAALAVLLAIANAYTYQTILTTTVDDGNYSGRPKNRSEQAKSKGLTGHCKQYFKQGMGIETAPRNSHPVRRCCHKLQKLDEQCQCEGIKLILQKLQGEFQGQEELQEMMVQRAKVLPTLCGSRAPCEIQMIWLI